MRRRKPLKTVRCTVRFIAGGSTRKTVKRKLTMAQAIREIGGDPLSTEGRLMTGIPLNKRRSIVRGVAVVLMYVADVRPQSVHCCMPLDLQASRAVIRAGVPL